MRFACFLLEAQVRIQSVCVCACVSMCGGGGDGGDIHYFEIHQYNSLFLFIIIHLVPITI